MAEPPASKTLYVQRLNDKISKLGTIHSPSRIIANAKSTPDLKQALYYLFTPYGRILDIIALKTMKMRGQAFIAFRNANDAERAKQKLQGFELYGKKMVGSMTSELAVRELPGWGLYMCLDCPWTQVDCELLLTLNDRS